MVVQAAPVTSATVAVAVDVGKNEFAFSVTDSSRALVLKPRTGCPMTGPSLAQVVGDISRALPLGARVKVGTEAAGTTTGRCCQPLPGRVGGNFWS